MSDLRDFHSNENVRFYTGDFFSQILATLQLKFAQNDMYTLLHTLTQTDTHALMHTRTRRTYRNKSDDYRQNVDSRFS